ncbi:MAG TPA: amidohydrolase [Solirubrobacterales bacterium]|nr:amidohydrolase [Solirubrobacterales bacterium]
MSLAITGATLDGHEVGLRAEGGRIAEVGPDARPRKGDEVVDAAGRVLLPGLWNAHTHAAMTLFRGYGDDMPLMEWLQKKIWPVEAELEDDDVYWGTRLACAEMIRSGTVGFWDMYWRPGATARAVADAGLRAVIGAPLIDGGGAGSDEKLATVRTEAERSLDQLGDAGALVAPALAPHAIYTVSERSLRWIAERAAKDELPVHIHLSETEKEVSDCVAAHGVRPAHYLDRCGLLGPRTLLAHGVWLDEGELDLIAERGATLVTNPVANLKLAVGGVFPYPAVRARGIAVGLGTDGAGSNNSLDMFEQMKFLALIQKHAAGDPTVAPAGQVWEIATGARSELVGGSGNVAVGEPADFLLLSGTAPELTHGDLKAALVYAASGSVVDTTVVAGRVLMRGGHVDGLDQVRARAWEHAQRLGIA